MILGIPVVDNHELTRVCLDSLAQTVTGDNFTVVLIDNKSSTPYKKDDFKDYPFSVELVKFPQNVGFYYPLLRLFNKYRKEELIGLMHNDMVIYEHGWNERMEHSFSMDEKLGLVGLCGSNEIDSLGGRGGGTVCYFRGGEIMVGADRYIGQSQAAGRRTTDLVPAACLDSLFMMFRRSAIKDLVNDDEKWEDLPLAHFYDRIWPCRLIEKDWHVATLGVECDHLGGMTSTGNMRFRVDCTKWLAQHNLLDRHEDPETALYLVAEDRYLGEYREQKQFLPFRIEGDYRYVKT